MPTPSRLWSAPRAHSGEGSGRTLAGLDQPIVGIGKVPPCRSFAGAPCVTLRYAMYNATDDPIVLARLNDIIDRVKQGPSSADTRTTRMARTH